MKLRAILRCACHAWCAPALACAFLCATGSLPALAAEQAITVEQCVRHFANDPATRALCVAEAAQAPAPPSEPQLPVPGLVAPLTNLIVIFGFFDRRFTLYNGGLEHLGVDFAAAPGTGVHAICDGRVVLSRTDHAQVVSSVLVIEHQCPEPLGQVYAYYGHVHSPLAEGEAVSAGAGIGTVRDWQHNSHLHFGLSTQLLDEHWGTHPRGVTLQRLAEQGWLNPLNYFIAARNGELKRVAPKPAVHRQHRARNITSKRRR